MKKLWILLMGLFWILTSCKPTDVVKVPLITTETIATSQPLQEVSYQ